MIRLMEMRRWARTGGTAVSSVMLAAVFATGQFAAAATTAHAQDATTTTTLSAETHEVAGRTVATFRATVAAEDGVAVQGSIQLFDTFAGKRQSLAGAAIDARGVAEIELDGLATGDHLIEAVYSGAGGHAGSRSEAVSIHPLVTAVPDFTLTISPTSLDIAAPGDSGVVTATITPVNGFTGFLSLSCSGPPSATTLPQGVTCTYAPANLQVIAPTTANPTGTVTAQLSVATSAPQLISRNEAGRDASARPLLLAAIVPGVLLLAVFGRKLRGFSRLTLLVLLAAMTLLGASACSARYRYLNHGPHFGGTPVGSYTLTVTAQTSNGVTATEHATSLALNVK